MRTYIAGACWIWRVAVCLRSVVWCEVLAESRPVVKLMRCARDEITRKEYKKTWEDEPRVDGM